MQYNSSWCIFPTEKENYPVHNIVKSQEKETVEKHKYRPYSFFGKAFTFENPEKKTLDTLREWAKTYFSKFNVVNNDQFVLLSQAKAQKGDFDLLVKIVQFFEKDEHTFTARVRDASGQTWFIHEVKKKYPELKQGQVVRVRSANVDNESSADNTLKLGPHSNILSFISVSKLAKETATKVKDDNKTDSQLLASKDFVKAPVVVSEVSQKFKDMPYTDLNDLFHHPDSPAIAKKTLFKTRFFVVKVEDRKSVV